MEPAINPNPHVGGPNPVVGEVVIVGVTDTYYLLLKLADLVIHCVSMNNSAVSHSLLSGVRYTLVMSRTLCHSDNSDVVPVSLCGPELGDTLCGLSGDKLL